MSGLGLELTERQRTLLAALVPVLALFLLNPLLDLVVLTWPFRFDEISWRFGFFGLVLGSTVPLATAAALIALVGTLLGHRGMLRLAAVVLGVHALVLIGGIVLFGLDALQVRRTVAQTQKDRFDATAFKTLIIATLYVPIGLWSGWKLFATAKGGETAKTDRAQGLVVGQ